jgi:hypothetical protein
MTLSIIFEPMCFSQANRGENYQFLFLACIFNACLRERDLFFLLPPAHPQGGIQFIQLESLLAWLECARLAELTSTPISHPSFSDDTKPRSEKAWRATEVNQF